MNGKDTIFVGGFSGGIDSQAAVLWMRRHYGEERIILLNSEAGRNECPLTPEHVSWYSSNIHPVHECVPSPDDLRSGDYFKAKAEGLVEIKFNDLARFKGRFPSKMMQFCTEHLKLAPMRRWCKEHLKETYFEVFTGKRRNESARRRSTGFEEFDPYFDTKCHHPIADWSKEMCFEYVKAAGERINPLYAMGFRRIGCAPCVNSGKEDVANWAARFPAMIDKVRKWEREVGRTFFTTCVPGMEINWIDDVVKWAQTDHGGRQFPMYPEPREGCASAYGLCE